MITDNLTAGTKSAEGVNTMQSYNPTTRTPLPEQFSIATSAEIQDSVDAAWEAWKTYKNTSGQKKAVFLRTIATEIENLGNVLIQRAVAESGLPAGRIQGERGRTCNQLRLFAQLVEEGSWVDAVIDEAMPDRQPMPRVDIRKMSVALGPVAVFTASNFPLAFSTAGGDTASALAAGCPVIVKAHPSHLGTNALIAEAIATAIRKCGLPQGVFSSLQGGIETGQELVQHPQVKAVGFTGSYKGGKALFDLANKRPEPIPVYAEMGSNNPIFILPEKLQESPQNLATTIAGSVNLGAGQFCTNPGILVVQKGETLAHFTNALETAFAQLPAQTMLNEGIFNAYEQGKAACASSTGVSVHVSGQTPNDEWKGIASFASVSAQDFLQNNKLQEEVFGPFTLVVVCDSSTEFMAVAENLQGQLTATIMGSAAELPQASDLLDVLSQKAGRVIINGVPTGVEVCPAMHHGGPFPSTSNPLYTSVGTDAIKRFVRPVAYQNVPDSMLPPALQDRNPLNIWRTVNSTKTNAKEAK